MPLCSASTLWWALEIRKCTQRAQRFKWPQISPFHIRPFERVAHVRLGLALSNLKTTISESDWEPRSCEYPFSGSSQRLSALPVHACASRKNRPGPSKNVASHQFYWLCTKPMAVVWGWNWNRHKPSPSSRCVPVELHDALEVSEIIGRVHIANFNNFRLFCMARATQFGKLWTKTQTHKNPCFSKACFWPEAAKSNKLAKVTEGLGRDSMCKGCGGNRYKLIILEAFGQDIPKLQQKEMQPSCPSERCLECFREFKEVMVSKDDQLNRNVPTVRCVYSWHPC